MANKGLLIMALLIGVISGCAEATIHRVGDDKGWVVGLVNYTDWAATRKFYAGDSLLFSYEAEVHTVLQVTQLSYERCDTWRPVRRYDDGNTSVLLVEAGTYYFICGMAHHCPVGQKLAVRAYDRDVAVAPAHPPAASPLQKSHSSSSGRPSSHVSPPPSSSACQSPVISTSPMLMSALLLSMLMMCCLLT